MARLRTRRNANKAFTNNSHTLVSILAVFYVSTYMPAQNLDPTKIAAPTKAPTLISAPAFTFTPVSAPGPPERYIIKDLQKATKLALESSV